MAVDDEHGFILAGHATGANVADTTEMVRVLKASGLPDGASVSADKGYASESNSRALAEKGYQDRIMKKAYRNKPLSEEDKKRNKAIGKIRWVVERSFGTLKKVQEFVRARYLGLGKVDMEFNFQALPHNMKKAINLSA